MNTTTRCDCCGLLIEKDEFFVSLPVFIAGVGAMNSLVAQGTLRSPKVLHERCFDKICEAKPQ